MFNYKAGIEVSLHSSLSSASLFNSPYHFSIFIRCFDSYDFPDRSLLSFIFSADAAHLRVSEHILSVFYLQSYRVRSWSRLLHLTYLRTFFPTEPHRFSPTRHIKNFNNLLGSVRHPNLTVVQKIHTRDVRILRRSLFAHIHESV